MFDSIYPAYDIEITLKSRFSLKEVKILPYVRDIASSHNVYY